MNRGDSYAPAGQLISGRRAERRDNCVIALHCLRIVVGRIRKSAVLPTFDADDLHACAGRVKAELIRRQGLRTGIDKKVHRAECRLLRAGANRNQQCASN